MKKLAPLALVVGALACVESGGPLDPAAPISLARSGQGACAATPTTVVADEASLHAAAAAAQPGDVIAIDGRIELHIGVLMETEDVTLTCATPGATLAFAPGVWDFALVWAVVDRVAVTDLHLDATGGDYAVYSYLNDGQRTERNTIVCAVGCAYWVSSTNALVAHNTATAVGSVTGFHFQTGIDGTRIEHNTITAVAPSGISTFGGIRPRDGVGVVVADNVVSGPWSNAISAVNLNDGELARNVLQGAQQFGLAVNISGSPSVAFSSSNRFTANRVEDAAIAGFLVQNACYNTFTGNPSLGTTPFAFMLEPATGANVVVGTAGTSMDAGAWDCDGDGDTDPNRVSGDVVSPAAAPVASASHAAAGPDTPQGARGELPALM